MRNRKDFRQNEHLLTTDGDFHVVALPLSLREANGFPYSFEGEFGRYGRRYAEDERER
jgi:hypothetical protein